jgi:hypothetical protein
MQGNVRNAMTRIMVGTIQVLTIVALPIVDHAIPMMHLQTIFKASVQLATIRVGGQGRFLTTMDLSIVHHVIPVMLLKIIIHFSAQTAIHLVAGVIRALIMMDSRIVYPAM